MAKGLRRFQHTGDWHFITCSCYRRQKFLDWVHRRDFFLEILEQVRAKFDFAVAEYAVIHPVTPTAGAPGTPVMPEHFHLLVSKPRPLYGVEQKKQRVWANRPIVTTNKR